MQRSTFNVSAAESGARLDVFLVRKFPDETRTAIQKWIEQAGVPVKGHKSKSSYRLRNQDRIEFERPEISERSVVLEPWNYPLSFLYEDEDLIAINKPSRIVTHPGAGKNVHTLANAILFS